MSTAAAPTSDFWGVLSEQRRILNANTRHFQALSAIFLLPLSFTLYLYPFLLLQSDPRYSQHPIKALTFHLLYSLLVFLLSICATGTITHSSYHGFHGRSVELTSSIKSLSSSFLPLLATSIVAGIFVLLIAAAFGISIALILTGAQFLGLQIDYASIYFSVSWKATLVMYLLVVAYVKLNWCLASVIVMVESKWGLEPLRRSWYLVRGMRGVSLGIMLYYGYMIGYFLWGYMIGIRGGWWSWVVAVLSTFLATMFMLHNVVAMTVLYVYCKAVHGELSLVIPEEEREEGMDGDYVRLPMEDGDETVPLPHGVNLS